MLSIKSDNLNQSRLHSQRFMKLARAAYARVLIIPHSVSVEHRADQWIIFFFKFAKGRSLSLFHQCKAWSSADRRHTRSESALVVGGQLLFRNIYLCPMYFYPNFLEAGFHAGSQCGPRLGVANATSDQGPH